MADTLSLPRRAFLSGVAAAAIAPALPAIAAPAAAQAAAAEILPMFVCGTTDAFNWRPYAARTAEEAWGMWCDEAGYHEPEDRDMESGYVERVPKWDGRSEAEIKPGDWIKAGLGHCCSRCDGETHAEFGAQAVGDEAVCQECLTFADKIYIDEGDALDELADMIADVGADEAQASLIEHGDWDIVPESLWQRAVKLAEETS